MATTQRCRLMTMTVATAVFWIVLVACMCPAQAQITASVRANTFLYVRSNVCQPSDNNTAVEVVITTEDKVTQHPWVQAGFNGSALFVYGTAPEVTKAVNVTLYGFCYFANLRTSTRSKTNFTIKLTHVPQDVNERRIVLRITNFNQSQLLENQYNNIQAITTTLNTQLSSSGNAGTFYVGGVEFTDLNPRNRPASEFSPPVAPPNFWVNRSSNVTLAYVSNSTAPSCTAVRSALSSSSSSVFVYDWTKCDEVVVPKGSTGVGSGLGSVEGGSSSTSRATRETYSRSTRDFKKTVVPAVVVAVILFVVVTVCILLSWCCGPSKSEVDAQQEALVLNKLNRAQENEFRQYRDDIIGTQIEERELTEVPREKRTDRLPGFYSSESLIKRKLPPPTYRAPPMHRFDD